MIRMMLLIFAVAAGTPGPTDEAAPPAAVFADLDGTWRGRFIGLDTSGRELYRIQVVQRYRTVSDTRQEVAIEDVAADGSVTRGSGYNEATRRPDGTLTLRCVVEKSTGDRVEHAGRLIKGPDGDKQIVWYSDQPGRVETFRESVRRAGDRTVYEINGLGRYGDTLMLMHGRYTKDPEADHAPEGTTP